MRVVATFLHDAYYEKYCSMLGMKVVSKKSDTPVLGAGVKLLKGKPYVINLQQLYTLYIPRGTKLLITKIKKAIYEEYKEKGTDDNNNAIQFQIVPASAVLDDEKVDRKLITMEMLREYPVGVHVQADNILIVNLYRFFCAYTSIINWECGSSFIAVPCMSKHEKIIEGIRKGEFLKGVEFDEEHIIFTGFAYTQRLDKKLALLGFAEAIVEYSKKPDTKYPCLTSFEKVISLLGCENWILQTLSPVP